MKTLTITATIATLLLASIVCYQQDRLTKLAAENKANSEAMRILLATDECKSPSVTCVLTMIHDLARRAPVDEDVINIEVRGDDDIAGARLYEDTLTDGSKVYSIQLRQEDGDNEQK